jgi:ethanolamine ammonia-lyase small subunit
MSDPLWAGLRRATAARIGLGRAGNGLPTAAELEFRAAHADARDAVHDELDVDALAAALATLGCGEPARVTSRAADRSEYLRRPDLGREPGSPLPSPGGGELAVVCADGLSARAVAAHAVPLLSDLVPRLSLPVAAPVVATRARVALGDHIGAALGARVVLVLIGERPGLSAVDSLGAYLTFEPRPGRSDAERNCVSNIRTPGGLGYADAARVLASLLGEALRLGESGVRVKDRSRPELPG